MPQYSTAATQTVAVGQNVVFTETPVGCRKGFVMHRDGSGIVTLRGTQNGARYKVVFTGNIAVAEGGTVGPIAAALAVNGEALYGATAIVTPAAIGDFFSVAAESYIDVPCGCCVTVSVRNVLPQNGTAPGTAIDVANASLLVTREA